MKRTKENNHAVAIGFAIGVFVSFTPFLGFHLILGMILSFAVGGSFFSCFLGTLIGNPITFPFFWWGSYQTGRLLLFINNDGSSLKEIMHTLEAFANVLHQWNYEFFIVFLKKSWPTLAKPFLFGSFVVGILASFISYVLVYTSLNLARRAFIDKDNFI